MLVPWMWHLLDAVHERIGAGSPAASRTVGAMSMTWQNWDLTRRGR